MTTGFKRSNEPLPRRLTRDADTSPRAVPIKISEPHKLLNLTTGCPALELGSQNAVPALRSGDQPENRIARECLAGVAGIEPEG
jgi:hypothetical protein